MCKYVHDDTYEYNMYIYIVVIVLIINNVSVNVWRRYDILRNISITAGIVQAI